MLSHHRRRVLHFGVTEHPGFGWFCTPFAHTSRTLTFLRFLFLAPADLFFSLQASVEDPRCYEPKNTVEHSYPISTIPFSFSHTATPTALWVLMLRMKEIRDKTTIETSSETVNTEALHPLKVMSTSFASFSSSLPATASLPRLSMPW